MKVKGTWIVITLVIAGGLFYIFRRGASEADEIEYRYEKLEAAELVRSTTATGVIKALTSIDVRSKAGGTIVKLAVDEGSEVKQGDLIAIIDPRDTQATFDQANADLQSASSRIAQAEANLRLQRANSVTAVRDAEIALEQAKLRLEKAKLSYERTPASIAASIQTAETSFATARQELERFQVVTKPQRMRDATGQARQAEASFKAAQADLERQRGLLEKGYVSQSIVDRAVSTYESARAAHETAQQRMATLERDLQVEERTLKLSVDRAEASLKEAKTSGNLVKTSEKELREAETAVRAAEVALQRAKDARTNDAIRAADLSTARASAVRSRVAMDNAKVQLDSTTVVAPRDGVVTLKYAEEGTVIPAGVSQFSSSANIVQLSDVTRLFVDCSVDEADFSNIKVGQKVRVLAEAFPAEKLEGIVRRVSPSAVTANNITAITVRVEVLQSKDSKIRLLPGMNATCEFITLSKPNVLLLPSQAVKRDQGKTYVMVKGTDPKKPVRKDVQLGESGNDGVEVISGIEAGTEVVVAEINLKQLRETQQRMIEAQQGGGLAGGGAGGMGGRPGAGGARGGAGGGSRGGGGR